MWQNTAHRLLSVAMILIVAFPVALLPGCGNNQAVPDGSTIEVNPTTTSVAGLAADTTFTYTVTIRYADGTPAPGVPVRINGPFAVPRNVAGSLARYQFLYYMLEDPKLEFPQPVNSGFTAQTDEWGCMSFSITVFGTVGGAANLFTDTITITSGSAQTTITLNFT